MSAKLTQPHHAICRPHWWDILVTIKCSLGLPVKDISKTLNMSYMGIRQHLDNMEAQQLVHSARRAQPVGRPQKAYFLTERGQQIFQRNDPHILTTFLAESSQLYGSNAPEKLILHYFEHQTRHYLEHIDGNSVHERSSQLARLRSQEGYYSLCSYSPKTGLRIQEHHHPLSAVLENYPSAKQHEHLMLQRVLGTNLKRHETQIKSHHQISWQAPTI